ncbi:MAG: hypothetical protein R2726_12525 [Acidimicrobiales bacterium]
MSAPAELLAHRLAAAEAALDAAAGDRSLCDLSRAGAPGGVKELEGRLAALLEVRRATRREPTRPLTAVVEEVRPEWQHQLVVAEERQGPVWVAYRRGGVGELAALAADLDAGPSPV